MSSSSPTDLAVELVRKAIASELKKRLADVRVGDSRSEIASRVEHVLKQAYGAPDVRVDGSRLEEGIISANVTLPVHDDFQFITMSVHSRPGRFPSRSQNPCREVPLCHPPLPRPGSLVRALTGDRQFGIIGEREGKVGVFWSNDGWVCDYEKDELQSMFADCLEVIDAH